MNFPSRRDFNFDAALRYYPVVNLLEKSPKNLSILEVGSGTNGISDFYDGQIIGLDSDFSKTDTIKNKNIQHIRGLITKIPFEDNKFDFVICLDTFEHIKISDRKKAIEEMLRVAKKKGMVIIGFPTSKMSEKMEIKINLLYKKKQGMDHVWLKEHRQNGLPDKKEILKILEDRNIKPKKIEVRGNVNIYIWFILHWLYTVNDASFMSKVLKRFYKVFFYVLRIINIGPFYRIIYIIQK